MKTSQNISQNIYLKPKERLYICLILQLCTIIILLVPTLYTRYTGKTVILQTRPTDPYDTLRGYYVALEYDISRVETLKKLPGWNDLVRQYPGINSQYYPVAEKTNLYVILHSETINQPWRPLRVTTTLPATLPENQVALRGRYEYGSIVYGLEKYYMPEVQADFGNQDIFQTRQIRLGQPKRILLLFKIDSQGNPAPLEMQVTDTSMNGRIHRYRF
ncbi:hypothetical protein NIES4071_65150 [Calothrix sp. NIES-4071]|nr:hypothetical protein NIES4071_65150 [Calothrix sp. NIES-4071]BAZ60819.1 hypothetical protein NIES4105_65110 [Calothrix sp. NIES-4105]